jgi:hypothetical protein
MSGSQIAYHLRVNKYIDRQLFLESLALVNRFIPLAGHGYVSMAGAYLEDCRVLHQATRITRMYSIEMSQSVVARQEVNRPFGFIQCRRMDSKELVEGFDGVRAALGDQDTNVVVWLDYAAANQRQAQLQQLGTLVPKLITGDVVRITLNAHRPTLGENQEYERLPTAQKPPTLPAWRYDRLREQLGEYMPGDRQSAEHLEKKDGFYRTMIRAVKHVVIGAIQPRAELLAVPVLSTAYDDQHGMVTVTFVVIRKADESEFRQAINWNGWRHNPGPEWDEYTEIQVPHLSMRERHILHVTLGHGGEFGGERPAFLTAAEIEQYQNHYLRYPTFVPADVL